MTPALTKFLALARHNHRHNWNGHYKRYERQPLGNSSAREATQSFGPLDTAEPGGGASYACGAAWH